ncbi:hypothetical protein Asulf_02053 [Archaeoglobus sulfaticallidus PM70-1]|uniref:Uncharacterized protein n=1 Tax=Archaeoglobus sulfaticallidus PM70-1 TaxID=387631 RepID=N0BNW6_9EURY|nr:hypothetical protein [Archaeoglobus sulfaticallidus]AGK62015.1 hypothetical protein Asulf_02053 [Archaeoglobus sulfaticallidus PM70-1]
MKKAATILGCVAGICIQVGLLYGYNYIFVLLSYPALLTLGQLFTYIFQTGEAIGFHIPLTYFPLIHSASIPIFYALIGFVIGYFLKYRKK